MFQEFLPDAGYQVNTVQSELSACWQRWTCESANAPPSDRCYTGGRIKRHRLGVACLLGIPGKISQGC